MVARTSRAAILDALDGHWRSAFEIAFRAGGEGPDKGWKATRILGHLRDQGRADHNGRMGPGSRWRAAWRYPATREASAVTRAMLSLLDPTHVFEAFAASLVEGTPTLSLQKGLIWVNDEDAFDARLLLAALGVATASPEGLSVSQDEPDNPTLRERGE